MEQYLDNALGNRISIEAIGRVEIGEAAGLAELLDAERRHAVAEDAAEPRQRRRRRIGDGDEPRAGGEGGEQLLDVRRARSATLRMVPLPVPGRIFPARRLRCRPAPVEQVG